MHQTKSFALLIVKQGLYQLVLGGLCLLLELGH